MGFGLIAAYPELPIRGRTLCLTESEMKALQLDLLRRSACKPKFPNGLPDGSGTRYLSRTNSSGTNQLTL
ncbi:hypothetical protein SD10_24100 [Spirosoma radiotolerans]|uniref:Uncharacterized protein n=1 Tax=Spirosoma radiotolerans TaxID=1379870 RepID=A0A0E3ZYM1_9BACT|nr:hypothetical protein SD10_24100 [Spirosoma radiotolerans]